MDADQLANALSKRPAQLSVDTADDIYEVCFRAGSGELILESMERDHRAGKWILVLRWPEPEQNSFL